MALRNFNYYNRAYYYYLRTLGSVDPESYMQSLRKRKVGLLKVRVVVSHGLTQQERVESQRSNRESFEDDIVISCRRQK